MFSFLHWSPSHHPHLWQHLRQSCNQHICIFLPKGQRLACQLSLHWQTGKIHEPVIGIEVSNYIIKQVTYWAVPDCWRHPSMQLLPQHQWCFQKHSSDTSLPTSQPSLFVEPEGYKQILLILFTLYWFQGSVHLTSQKLPQFSQR